jgi:hypothetical protein
VPLLLHLPTQSLRHEQSLQFSDRLLEIIIEDKEVVLAVMRHFADRITHAPLDYLLAVLVACREALAQRLARRWQYEHADRMRQRMATRLVP